MREVVYTVKRSGRARKLRLIVRSDAGVIVVAPNIAQDHTIQQFVEAKKDWIISKKNAIASSRRDWIRPSSVANDSYFACRARAKKFVVEKVRQFNWHYGFEYSRIAVKNLKTRWGSCSGDKNLNFHYRLYFLPEELADYVVVHELCHLKEMNHSKNFWQLVGETIPNFAQKRAELKKYPAR